MFRFGHLLRLKEVQFEGIWGESLSYNPVNVIKEAFLCAIAQRNFE